MAANQSPVSHAVNALLDTYQKSIYEISQRLSTVEVEHFQYDEYSINEEIAHINEQLKQGLAIDTLLCRKLFLESMIFPSKNCEETYRSIQAKDSFAEYGFPAICYDQKSQYDWAYEMAKEYYKRPLEQNHPVLLVIYARLLLQREEMNQAETFALKAVESAPCMQEAHLILRELYDNSGKKTDALTENQILDMLGKGAQQ